MIPHRLLNIDQLTIGWEALGGLRGGRWHNPIYLLEGLLWLFCGEQFRGDQEWTQRDQLGVHCFSPGGVDAQGWE